MMNEELKELDEELALDDQLGVDDPLDLIRAYIDCALAKSFFCDSHLEHAAPVKNDQQDSDRRLFFVITRNRSSSWSEDISDYTSIAERNRTYN